MARDTDQVPTALLHALKHYKVLHERVVLMQVRHRGRAACRRRASGSNCAISATGFYTIRIRYGFMDEPNILRALAQCRIQRFRFNLMETSFIIGREKLRAGAPSPAFCRAGATALFILMSNTALDATEFFRIPPNRVVELGGQIEL